MIEDVVWSSGASADLQATFSYLEDSQPGSGESLLHNIDQILTLLRIFPEQGAIYSGLIRRLLVGRRKQYGLFYSVTGMRIHVIAFVDLRRNPEEIANLLRDREAG